jgi:hypothetical protein
MTFSFSILAYVRLCPKGLAGAFCMLGLIANGRGSRGFGSPLEAGAVGRDPKPRTLPDRAHAKAGAE